ncbi:MULTISPECIES: hypothetical protein [unclassified Ruminococcus]|uniref:hypothetical protein n=1 Tax=unclassified Ruminococcus TaxID=2608920 RepID=UPI00210D8DBF|nr:MULTISPECIES: hypothetical protein [unclassified Ruminococcus]MCQ4021673.1 hypothetical protein [Ruminococcus sp. zg-924]MCQ4114118.1 hypothetical protein [Ruminococcus sp. zg-921]
MTNLESLDSSAREYFYSLPQLIQEQIIESGVTFSSKQELESYYNSVTEKKNMNN